MLGLFLITGCDKSDSGGGNETGTDTTAKADDTPPPPPAPEYDYNEDGLWFGPMSETPVLQVGDSVWMKFCLKLEGGGEDVWVQFRGSSNVMTEGATCAQMLMVGKKEGEVNAEGFYEIPYSIEAEVPSADGTTHGLGYDGVFLVSEKE